MKVRKLLIQLLQKQSLVILESSTRRVKMHEFANLVQNIVDIQALLHNIWGFSPEARVYKNWLNDLAHPTQIGSLEIVRLMSGKFSKFYPHSFSCGGNYYKNND